MYGVYFRLVTTQIALIFPIAVPGDCPRKDAVARESGFELAILIIIWFDSMRRILAVCNESSCKNGLKSAFT